MSYRSTAPVQHLFEKARDFSTFTVKDREEEKNHIHIHPIECRKKIKIYRYIANTAIYGRCNATKQEQIAIVNANSHDIDHYRDEKVNHEHKIS